MNKDEYNKKSLREIMDYNNRNIQLIDRGISDKVRNFQFESGISGIKISLDKLRFELNELYNNNLPSGMSEAFRLLDYIIQRLNEWWAENNLFGNKDAEIFLDSLKKQLDKINEIIIEIEKDFN